MLKNEVIDFLKDNGFDEVEALEDKEDYLLVKFFFDFDDAVLEAAKAYSNDESDYEEESNEWYQEYYLPYLYDFANDQVLEVIEDVIEEYDIAGEVMGIQMKKNNSNYTEFIALFTEEESSISIEDVVKDYIV